MVFLRLLFTLKKDKIFSNGGKNGKITKNEILKLQNHDIKLRYLLGALSREGYQACR